MEEVTLRRKEGRKGKPDHSHYLCVETQGNLVLHRGSILLHPHLALNFVSLHLSTHAILAAVHIATVLILRLIDSMTGSIDRTSDSS